MHQFLLLPSGITKYGELIKVEAIGGRSIVYHQWSHELGTFSITRSQPNLYPRANSADIAGQLSQTSRT